MSHDQHVRGRHPIEPECTVDSGYGHATVVEAHFGAWYRSMRAGIDHSPAQLRPALRKQVSGLERRQQQGSQNTSLMYAHSVSRA
jgi:hypothetical protein